MESLPNTSEASLSRGFWFVFPLAGRTIRAWGGCSGLERVYVDDGVVSEHRSIGTKSVHVFSIDGDNYAIWFKTIDLLKGQLECTLLKNGVTLKSYMMSKYIRDKSFFWVALLLLYIAGGGALGFSWVYFRLPFWVVLALFALIPIAVRLVALKQTGFSIEEIPM